MKTFLPSLIYFAVSGVLAWPFGDKSVAVIDEPRAAGVNRVAAPPDSVSAGVNADELTDLTKFAQYAGASYCDPVVNKRVLCKGDICPAGKNSNATIYAVFHGIETDILGFVAIDTSTQEIIVSIRGTSSLYNWLADVVWARQPTALCPGCWVHLGFLFAYGEIIKPVNASLAAATRLYPAYKVSVAGHSLGGAVGTLLAMRLRAEGYELDLYTYGAPRVGNEAFAQYLSHKQKKGAGRNFRVTHWADLVARLPPLSREFRHASPEYWLAQGPAPRTAYAAGEVATCAGYANAACNAGAPWWQALDVTSHLYYLVAISHCGGEGEARLRFVDDEPLNATGGGVDGSGSGLDQATADTLAMYAKLDQEYAGALQSGVEGAVVF